MRRTTTKNERELKDMDNSVAMAEDGVRVKGGGRKHRGHKW